MYHIITVLHGENNIGLEQQYNARDKCKKQCRPYYSVLIQSIGMCVDRMVRPWLPQAPCGRQVVFYTEKAPNAWHRRGAQKTGNTYNLPNRPNRHTSQTKHQALPKGQPGRRITPINTACAPAGFRRRTPLSELNMYQLLPQFLGMDETPRQSPCGSKPIMPLTASAKCLGMLREQCHEAH